MTPLKGVGKHCEWGARMLKALWKLRPSLWSRSNAVGPGHVLDLETLWCGSLLIHHLFCADANLTADFRFLTLTLIFMWGKLLPSTLNLSHRLL
jgi:hypothetical protein